MDKLVFSTIGGKEIYGHVQHDTQNKLVAKLSQDLNCGNCVVTSSGMSAISTVLHGVLSESSNYTLVYGSELYCDTTRLFKNVAKWYNLNNHVIDVLNMSSVDTLFKTQLKGKNVLLFVESCTNPFSQVLLVKVVTSLTSLT